MLPRRSGSYNRRIYRFSNLKDFNYKKRSYKMKIDVRNKQCVYIKIDDYTFYIDNSTNEQIMNCWHKNDPVDTVRNTNNNKEEL